MSEEKLGLGFVSSYCHFLGKLQNSKKYIAEMKIQKFLKKLRKCQIVSKDILNNTILFILLYINSVIHINQTEFIVKISVVHSYYELSLNCQQ